MKVFLLIILFASFLIQSNAQQYFIRGKVTDNLGEPLSFANIRVLNSAYGTSSNKEGEYELKLKAGSYLLTASFIGYLSDTLSIELKNDLFGINFHLSETNVVLEEIVVKPGENPALEIIRRAIRKKNERDAKLISYEFEAFTKGIIKTAEDLIAGNNSVSIGAGTEDTAELKITGILENQSHGYFEKPGNYKEVIIARKQTANFPSSINVLTGGRLIKIFYEDEINFFNKPLPGPLANNALAYYYFYIENQLAIDSRRVYQIYLSPEDRSDPGFEGRIYIADSTYDLIKVDLQLNRAANIGGIFDTVNIFQQFLEFGDSIYMPVDYRLVVSANYLGLIRFGLELNTILYDYKINPKIDENIFNKAIVTVLPEADNKDSLYWQTVQTIPNTAKETTAYKRIDSLTNIPRSFWDDFSFLASRLNFNENFSVSAPLAMYHFNRIEGHTVDFGLFFSDLLNKRLNSSLNLSYGFADKRVKVNFYSKYLLGDYRTYYVSINGYNKLKVIGEGYDEFTSTILSLFSKYDFSDYYYSSGFKFEAGGEFFPILALRAGFENNTDKDAYVNTNFSFFGKDKIFRENPAIFKTRINALTAGFTLDFRDYIEDGLFRRRAGQGNSYIIFNGDVAYSSRSILKSELNFTNYKLRIEGTLNTFKSAQLNFNILGIKNIGRLPYQLLYAIPGNIDLLFLIHSFRTLNINEIKGENIVTVNLEHDFGDELFRLMMIPGLKDWEIQLKVFVNAAYADIKGETSSPLTTPVKTFPHPFYEIGFGLGHILIPLEVEFAWKLNYRDGNNFRAGLNIFIFQSF